MFLGNANVMPTTEVTVPVPAFDPPAPTASFTEWGLLLLNALVIAATVAALWLGWRSELRSAEQGVQSTGRLLAQTVADKLDKTAVAADGLASQLESELRSGGIDRERLWPLVDARRARLTEAQTLAVFDAMGQQVCGTAPAERCRHLSVADRLYFQAARNQTGSDIRLHGPVESRLDGQPVLMLVRPLRSPDGAFAGIVSALLPLENLRELLRSAHAGDGSVASLRTIDMALVARDPPLPRRQEQGQVSANLRAALARNPQEGMYRAVTPTDGIDRITLYQRLQAWPLYVLVGSASTEALTNWRIASVLAVVMLVGLAGGSVKLAMANRERGAQAQRAQYLYETAPCGYHTLDAQGRFLSINRTELEWLGWASEELIGKRSPRDFFSPEAQQTFDESFPTLRQRGRLDNLKVDMTGRDGRKRQLAVSAKALVDSQGTYVGSNSVLHDITPLHEAERQLRELAEIQSLMLSNDLIGMARLQSRHIVWANPGMSRLLGYTEDELVGMPMRQLYLDEATFEQVGSSSYPLLAKGRAHRIEVQMRHKDGTARWMDAGGAPLGEGPVQVLMMLADISDRKSAEAMKLRAVELQAQNAQLLETNRLQDEFLANMSHELRTPLNGILGIGSLMRRAVTSGDAEKLQRYLDQVMSSGQHLLTLVQTQLDFARVEAGKLPIDLEPVDLPAVLAELAAVLQPVAQSATVTLETQCDPSLRTVMTDPMRLRQVLSLLSENAVKFSMPGGRVWLRAVALNDLNWSVEVEDEGIGIAPADQERIFAKFTQLSSGSTKQYGGAGMGLALARQLARAMGGNITVRSQLGHGSVFTLVLPTRTGVASPVSRS